MLPDRGPDRAQPQQSQAYTPPPGFYTEVQTSQAPPQASHAFTLHEGFRPEIQTSTPTSVAPTSSPSVVRQVETVTDNSGRTLAIVLASIALAVALGSLCYASIRLARVQRRELGSH
jgi:uncharacterized protein HemX